MTKDKFTSEVVDTLGAIYARGFEAGKKETATWIPVSERLPEIHQDVLLSLRSLDIVVGFRAETEPYFYCYCADSCYIESQNVLAWMSLPQPYAPQESEE